MGESACAGLGEMFRRCETADRDGDSPGTALGAWLQVGGCVLGRLGGSGEEDAEKIEPSDRYGCMDIRRRRYCGIGAWMLPGPGLVLVLVFPSRSITFGFDSAICCTAANGWTSGQAGATSRRPSQSPVGGAQWTDWKVSDVIDPFWSWAAAVVAVGTCKSSARTVECKVSMYQPTM